VITVHDLAFLHWPHFLTETSAAYYGQIDRGVHHAKHVIVPSESTKQDLVRLLGVPDDHVSVIYEAANPRFRPLPLDQTRQQITQQYSLPQKYILYVGTVEPRKNIDGLLRAFRHLLDKYSISDTALVIAGGFGWLYEETMQVVKELKLEESVQFLGRVPDEDLHSLYVGARCHVHVAHYEGFGLTPLEAMACGTPTIVSNTSSLPEVVGDAALLVDPGDAEEIAIAMHRLLTNDDLHSELCQKGFRRAGCFSWDEAARQTLKVYASVLSESDNSASASGVVHATNGHTMPTHGSSIRNYNLIRTLAEHHTIDLLAFSVPDNQLAAANPLNEICRNIATVPQPVRSSAIRILDTARRRLPDMALRLESQEMHLLVQQWTVENRHQTQYDIVQIEGIEMAQYGLAIADAFQRLHDSGAETGHETEHGTRPALVFDDHNCEYLLQKRNALNDLRLPLRWPAAAYSVIQWQKLKWYESLICRQMDAVSVVSPADKAILGRLVDDVDITVISNGITLEEYESENGTEPRSSTGKGPLDGVDGVVDNPHRQSKKLIFVGKMDYRPNVDAVLWFVYQVLPLIQEQEPTVTFEIVGMNPHPRLDQIRGKRGVTITGKVAEVPPYLHTAACRYA